MAAVYAPPGPRSQPRTWKAPKTAMRLPARASFSSAVSDASTGGGRTGSASGASGFCMALRGGRSRAVQAEGYDMQVGANWPLTSAHKRAASLQRRLKIVRQRFTGAEEGCTAHACSWHRMVGGAAAAAHRTACARRQVPAAGTSRHKISAASQLHAGKTIAAGAASAWPPLPPPPARQRPPAAACRCRGAAWGWG